MMQKSDPQLREDIRQLQARILQLESELTKARADVRVVEKVVIKPVDVVRDDPATIKALARAQAENEKLRQRLKKPKEKIVEKVVKIATPCPEMQKRISYLEAEIDLLRRGQ